MLATTPRFSPLPALQFDMVSHGLYRCQPCQLLHVLLLPLHFDTTFLPAQQFARAAQILTVAQDEGGLVHGNQVGC